MNEPNSLSPACRKARGIAAEVMSSLSSSIDPMKILGINELWQIIAKQVIEQLSTLEAIELAAFMDGKEIEKLEYQTLFELLKVDEFITVQSQRNSDTLLHVATLVTLQAWEILCESAYETRV